MEPTISTVSVSFAGRLALNAGESGRLEATLQRLTELSQKLRAGSSDVDPKPVLSALRVDLELHFALEESPSYFGLVLRDRPSLSHGISKLRHEHAELLAKLERLRHLAEERVRWAELAQPAVDFVDAFKTHEQEEADLLQEFFLRDDGVGAD